MKKLLIFDGNSILNRAFYGVRPLTTRQGLSTGALFGFLNIVKKHLDAQHPDYCAVAFDVRAKTFRHKACDFYKANRKGMPEELASQMPYAHRLAEKLGIAVLEKEGYEADDFLGTASALAEEAGIEAVLVTGDRDALQLVSDTTTVLLATTGADVAYTPEVIREKYALSPRQLIDVKALMGDSSDNIPGVRGIGEKGALDLIQRAGTLDQLYATLDTLSLTGATLKKLTEGKESAYTSRFLAEIVRSMPDLTSLDCLAIKSVDKEGLAELFTELEFTRLAEKFSLTDLPKQKSAPTKKEEKIVGTSEKPAFFPTTGQISLDFSDTAPQGAPLDEAESAPLPSLDAIPSLEGLCALWEEGRLFVRVPTSGETFVLKEADTVRFLAEARPFVFDSKAYFHFAEEKGLSPAALPEVEDLQLMAYLLDPSGAAASLSRTATVFLSRLLSPSATVTARLDVLSELSKVLPKELAKSGLTDLYRNVDLPLARVLCEMESVGVKLDRAPLLAYGEKLRTKLSEIEGRIHEAAGDSINLNSPKQLGRLLFETLGLPHAKKTKTGYSTDAETLEKLRPLSPVVEDILEYRKFQKLLSTYVESLTEVTQSTPRVHTTFLQAQTVTGRLSSMEPNLQNIPVRTEEGRELRRFFVAEDGYVLLDADYSQVELRILAHLSGDEALLDAFRKGEDIHTRTASEIFRVPPSEVTPSMRKDAKAVNFGIVYGIGEYSLSQDLKIPIARAAEYIKGYFATYPKVQSYLASVIEAAKESGEVRTLFGRLRKVPELSASNKNMRAFGERVAMNTPIQGTAADIMKLAMVHVYRRLKSEGYRARILLQVHDELLLESPIEEKDAVRSLLKEEMEKAASLTLTLEAEVGEGANWLEAKD